MCKDHLWNRSNYKDALAATGHPGIVKNFPHVPGIDAVGRVIESNDARFVAGQVVLTTGHELGVERWGGWAERLQVPGAWLLPLPPTLSAEECMLLGTAGFTASQCVKALIHNGVFAGSGDIVVTGATGGVGSLSVMILAQLGYDVVAVTGKEHQHDWLKEIGAKEVVGRNAFHEDKPRPLQSTRFAGGIDTVGGWVLASVVKRISHRGCVACCGMAGGTNLDLTVYPFILRGVTLAGIDSAWCPEESRQELWKQLATSWKPKKLDILRHETTLENVSEYVNKLLNGENSGRVLVKP